MIAGAQYNSPDLEYKRRLQEGDRLRKQTEADTRVKQQQIMQDELNRNQLRASNLAVEQSYGLVGDSSNPRTITGDSMTISNGGGASGSLSASRTSGSGSSGIGGLATGGFGNGGAQIDGRYMSLVQPPNPQLDTTSPAQVQMGEADFSPGDARAHQDAAFANLKAKSGGLGKGAIDSLMAQLSGRGITASGTTGRGIAERIVEAVNPLSDLNVAHLGEEYSAAQRARELSEGRAQSIYQGGIQQRGQDLSTQAALNNLRQQLALAQYQGEISQNSDMRAAELERLYRML